MTKIKSTNNDLQNIHKTTGHQHQNIDSFKQNLPSKITPTKPHSFFTWKFYNSVIDSYKTMYFYGDLNLFVTLMFIYIFLYSFIMLMVYYISLMWINKSMRICLCKILILHICNSGPGGSMSQVVGSNSSYKPTTNTVWVRAQLCKLQKRCTRLAAASDKAYQLLVQFQWFSPGTRASSTTRFWSP